MCKITPLYIKVEMEYGKLRDRSGSLFCSLTCISQIDVASPLDRSISTPFPKDSFLPESAASTLLLSLLLLLLLVAVAVGAAAVAAAALTAASVATDIRKVRVVMKLAARPKLRTTCSLITRPIIQHPWCLEGGVSSCLEILENSKSSIWRSFHQKETRSTLQLTHMHTDYTHEGKIKLDSILMCRKELKIANRIYKHFEKKMGKRMSRFPKNRGG